MELPKEIEIFFRENAPLAKKLAEEIAKLVPKVKEKTGLDKIKIMNFCGTHEWTTTHYGIRALLPEDVEMVPGPGCPVCVTPSSDIENAIKLALEGYRVYTFGDAYKLPTVGHYKPGEVGSLEEAKARGADVRIVYSFADAIEDAKKDGKPSVFFGIGFETTAPSYAVLFARGKVPKNLLLYSSLKLTAPAAAYAVEVNKEKGRPVAGVIGPGHVSTIIGAKSWDFFPEVYKIPAVVAGFEPIDALMAVLIILKNLYTGNITVTDLEYKRVVKREGNVYAQEEINKVFKVVDTIWRGIGNIPKSGLDLQDQFKEYNAKEQLGIKEKPWDYDLPPGCKCAEVTLGLAYPTDCPLFMKACTPSRPWGPCMVSSEGACAVWARFGSHKRILEIVKEADK